MTEDWLILSDRSDSNAEEELSSNNRIVIMDRFSGEVLATFQQDPFEGLILVSADDSFVYLVTYQAPKFGLAEKTPSRLFMIDKESVSLRQISLGDNIPAWNIQGEGLSGFRHALHLQTRRDGGICDACSGIIRKNIHA